jgi:hypothetical protein
MVKHGAKHRGKRQRFSNMSALRRPGRSPKCPGFSKPCRAEIERLHEAIEAERENLSRAESVLGCLTIAMEYETEGVGKPYYPDVAGIARELVKQSINRLDPLTLRHLRDKIEEEFHRSYSLSPDCLLTLDYHPPVSRPLSLRHTESALSASANI